MQVKITVKYLLDIPLENKEYYPSEIFEGKGGGPLETARAMAEFDFEDADPSSFESQVISSTITRIGRA